MAKTLDRETVSSYDLTIEVSDQGSPPRASSVKANITLTDVNDNSPTFTQQNYIFVVAENSSIGLSVGAVEAADVDDGANAALTYAFDSFSVGNGSHFSIHPSSGVISVNTPTLNTDLMPSYTARVKVSRNIISSVAHLLMLSLVTVVICYCCHLLLLSLMLLVTVAVHLVARVKVSKEIISSVAH